MAIIVAFLLTFTIVYASVSYFYEKYGSQPTTGYLHDGILTATEWDKLMTDLDTYSCPEQDCPEADCPSCASSFSSAIESYDGTRILPNNELDMRFYTADGSFIKNGLGLTRVAANESTPCWTASDNWNWNNLWNYVGSSTKLCAVLNYSPCTASEAGSYLVHVGGYWYNISISCLNNISSTPYVSVSVNSRQAVTRYGVSMEDEVSFPWNTWKIVKENLTCD